MFFTSVGFQANLKVLKSGGLSLLIFLICVIVLIVSQNGLALGLASLLGIDPYIGLCTGSIPMVGGHGTAGAFGPVLEDLGLVGATTLCTAAATFGLLAGSLMGGPLGRRLIFLGIAMITLKLWQLAELALPLLVLLLVQTLFMAAFAYFVIYNVMGRDYDAAVLAAGSCGFGMGATPNAMANMQALTDKFVPSIKAYLLVPIIGSMFADFINSITITIFINMVNNKGGHLR